jgi:hypothetical protein
MRWQKRGGESLLKIRSKVPQLEAKRMQRLDRGDTKTSRFEKGAISDAMNHISLFSPISSRGKLVQSQAKDFGDPRKGLGGELPFSTSLKF